MNRGAGGTPGGVFTFMCGLAMILGGLFLLTSNIMVSSQFSFGYSLYSFGVGYGINAGTLILLFVIGVGVIFFNSKSIIGWVLTIGALGALIIGLIMSLHMGIRPMSLLDMSGILILITGGFGLFLKSFKRSE